MNGDGGHEGTRGKSAPKGQSSEYIRGRAAGEMVKGNEGLSREIFLVSILNEFLQIQNQLAGKHMETSFNRIIGKVLNYEPIPPIRKDFTPNIVKVDLGNGRIGFKMEEECSKLPLITLSFPEFPETETEILMGRNTVLRERIPNLIFFRTASGNIYRLDVKRKLQNIRDLRNNKPPIALGKRFLENAILVIGEPFFYFDPQRNSVGSTSHVKEIIAVNTEPYSNEAVEVITQGRTDKIMQEFGENNPSADSLLPNAK